MTDREPASHEASSGPASDMRALFTASGRLGGDLLAVDWHATPLGPIDSWPQSLKTIMQVVLTSRFSMWMAWGPELTFFANETYVRDTLGAKYPWALGRPASEVWAEIWPDIGPRIKRVMQTGEASWEESLLLILERSGYPEETYHTFSYSPLVDESRSIAGMLCVVQEDTERVIAEQRMAILRDLGSALTAARTEDEVFTTATARLAGDLGTLPFSLVYLFEDDESARLVLSAGVAPGHPVAEQASPVATSRWRLGEVQAGHTALVEDLPGLFEQVPAGAWDEPASSALVVPLRGRPNERPYGAFVAGLNRYRLLDEGYEGFVRLIATQIAASVSNARAYEAERRRAERLAELDRAKTAFFTNVSHEFRTPLTLLLGPATDALRDGENVLLPEQHARLELVHRNGERLLRLVNTLLDFSRLEAGREVAHLEPVDLSDYTTGLAELFRPAVERAGLVLEVDCEPIGDVLVDREMVTKMLSNLLSNALKFTFSGGITVRVRKLVEDGTPAAELSVSDTGIGIAPDEQAHLFERFHRVEGARARTHEGSGIGLALVAELAAIQGGSVYAESVPEQGSTFTVRFPLASARLEGAAPSTAGPDAALAGIAAGFVEEALRWLEPDDASLDGAAPGRTALLDGDDTRARVLIVDDNADMRRYVRSLLADDYLVDAARDGAVALEMIEAATPDLVLTDVMMPRLDGFGLLRALRADPATTQIPIIMLSARAGEEAAIEGLDSGADDYLIKPFSALELLARVRSNLELERVRREASRQEHRIADELQRSMMPSPTISSDSLGIATYYQPGVRGTQVGGDWYDVIEAGAGRTILLIGDVMGRGVRAAAVMSQIRATARAFAQLGLAPADVLELMDLTVRELDEQLVTCIYAIYDSTDSSLVYASAGHLPPLLATPAGTTMRLTDALGPPLGAGPVPRTQARAVIPAGATIVFYTDGLVEQRGSDLDKRIDALAAHLAAHAGQAPLPATLAEHLCPDGADDDIAILTVQVPEAEPSWESVSIDVPANEAAVAMARWSVSETLERWAIPRPTIDDVVLLTSELVTNAIIHGRPPVELHLRRSRSELLLEVLDAANYLPRIVRPATTDEHGRGLQIVTRLAGRWGIRMTDGGKAVWCTTPISPQSARARA